MTTVDDDYILRYSRQMLLPGFEFSGQEALGQGEVLIVGLGGLGSAAAMYLAAAGVGGLLLADGDEIELSNLHRQLLYSTADVGSAKTDAAARRLRALNPAVRLHCHQHRLSGAELRRAVAGVGLVLDCSDNYATRFAVNAACFAERRPLVSGAAVRAEGQLAVFDFRDGCGPCYRCLYSEPGAGEPHSGGCADEGILSAVAGMVGVAQALEAIKLLSGYGQPLEQKLLLLDGGITEWRSLNLAPDPACPVCGADRHSQP